MNKLGMFVVLCVFGVSILACGSGTVPQATPVDISNHESFLLSNGFTFSSSFTKKCESPCQAYSNEPYNMRVELYNNGDITIAFGQIDDSRTEAQGTLMLGVVEEFFGQEAASWVINNAEKSVNSELTTDVNGYRLFMQIISPELVFTIIATPLD